MRLREITIPVLLMYGLDDFIWTPQAGRNQRTHFTLTEDLTYVEHDNAGHFHIFDGVAGRFRDDMAVWVDARW